MADADILKHSVTLDDYSQTPQSGAFFFTLSSGSMIPMSLPPDLNGLSVYASDVVTIGTIDQEPLWAGAVSIAITKVSSLSFEIQGDIPLRTRRGHELLMHFDADRGYVSGMSKILQDFILTNNGAFVEIVRVSTSMNSQIIGLIPLDSLRCTRTGNPDIPVVYKDLKGRSHELKAYEVMEFVDMPSNRAELFGSGRCAAARAYRSIYKLAAIDNYLGEKVTGRHPTAIQLVNGLNDPQLRSILNTGQSEADARGAIAYMGAIIATVPGDKPVSVGTIPLAEFPDNFDRAKETDLGLLSYANNLGLDVQDIQPLTGRALGTGAQSEVLDEKAKGKGLAAFRQQFAHGLSTWVLPDMTTFYFIEKDWRDKNLTADHNGKVETYVSDSIAAGMITAPQGLQVLVDENVYPKEFLPVDTTPDTTLTDDEKPGIDVPIAVVPPDVTPPVVETVVVPPVTKSINDLLLEQEQEAIALVDRIRSVSNA